MHNSTEKVIYAGKFLLIWGIAAIFFSCTPEGTTKTGGVIRFSFERSDLAGVNPNILLSTVDSSAGDSGTDGLISLKYFVAGITLYSDLTPNGSGFDVPTDAKQLWLYGSTIWQSGQSPFGFVEATIYADQYVDVMDPTDRARLSNTFVLDENSVGSWLWAVITIAPVIKVIGSVDLGNSVKLYTHTAVESTAIHGGSNPFDIAETTDALSIPPATEAMFKTGGGGMYYKMDKPLVITQEDIDQKTEFTVRFALETEGTLQGWKAGGTNTFLDHSGADYFLGYDTSIDDSGVFNEQIYAPNLNIIPILCRATDAVMREHYIINFTTTQDSYTVANRISFNIFWLQSDPARSILGLELHTLVGTNYSAHTALQTVPMGCFATPFSYSIAPGTGALTLWDFQSDEILIDFYRLPNKLANGTIMPGLVTGNNDPDTPAAINAASYQLVSLDSF